MCSKLTTKTIVSIVDFDQVNVYWVDSSTEYAQSYY